MESGLKNFLNIKWHPLASREAEYGEMQMNAKLMRVWIPEDVHRISYTVTEQNFVLKLLKLNLYDF